MTFGWNDSDVTNAVERMFAGFIPNGAWTSEAVAQDQALNPQNWASFKIPECTQETLIEGERIKCLKPEGHESPHGGMVYWNNETVSD